MRQIHLAEYLGILDSPTSGSYFFEGKQVDKMTENQLTALRKGNLGFIFQSFNLIDELTVYENVELPLVYLGMKTLQRKERVNKVLEKSTCYFVRIIIPSSYPADSNSV